MVYVDLCWCKKLFFNWKTVLFEIHLFTTKFVCLEKSSSAGLFSASTERMGMTLCRALRRLTVTLKDVPRFYGSNLIDQRVSAKYPIYSLEVRGDFVNPQWEKSLILWGINKYRDLLLQLASRKNCSFIHPTARYKHLLSSPCNFNFSVIPPSLENILNLAPLKCLKVLPHRQDMWQFSDW